MALHSPLFPYISSPYSDAPISFQGCYTPAALYVSRQTLLI